MATAAAADRCPVCHATRTEVQFKGHRRMGRIGHEYACPEACTCVPPHLTLAEHRTRLTDDDTASGPKSCYPEEIATLREMLEEQRKKLARIKCAIQSPDVSRLRVYITRRIEALTTAIEALGGAL